MLTKGIKSILMGIAAILVVLCPGCGVISKRPTVQDFREAADKGDISTLIAVLKTEDPPYNPSGGIDYFWDINSRQVDRYLAYVHLVLIGKPAVPALINALQNDTNVRVRGYVALALGMIGPRAEKAIPALIDSIPLLLEEQAITSPRKGLSPSEIPGYRITESWIKSAEELGIRYETLPEVQRLRSLYGKYVAISDVKFYRAVYQRSVYQYKDRGTRTIDNTIIRYSIEVAPFALSKITGEDFGNDKEKWWEWWKKNLAITP